MPIINPYLENVTPKTTVINWDRANPLPLILPFTINSPNDTESLKYEIVYTNTAIEWIGLGGYGGTSAYIDPFQQQLGINLYNLDLLPNGSFTVFIYFTWTPVGGFETMQSASVTINITGTLPNQITTDKPIYSLVYNRNTNVLTGDLSIGIVNNINNIPLKFWQNGSVFNTAENFTNGFVLEENPVIPMATNPALPNTGMLSIPAKILKQTDEFLEGFIINLTIVDGGIVIEPSTLAFEVFKGAIDQTAVLVVTNPLLLNWQATSFPTWLDLNVISDNNSLTEITVSTIVANAPIGEHSGFITFEFDGNSIDIPVTFVVKSFIFIDESKEFCLDLPPVIINRKSEAAKFVRITLNAEYNVLSEPSIFNKIYQSPYFKDVAKFDLGEKLHRHFPRSKQDFFNVDELVFMQKINANITVEELNANYEVLFTQNYNDTKLFPGKKPIAYPFLSNSIFRKKNENSIIFTSEINGESVIMKKRNQNAVPNPLLLSTSKINFYDFPDAYNIAHLQWENQNLCPEWFTFTGKYKITPEFNHIYAKNIFNAQNEKYDVSKTKTLTIETGMFLAKERLLMTEIIESKLAFIKIEGIVYRCFNITKNNIEVDSSEELISRPLEFLIVEQ